MKDCTHTCAHTHTHTHTHACSTQKLLMDDRSMEQIPSHPPRHAGPYEPDNSSVDENAHLLGRRSIQDENTDGTRGGPLQLQAPPKGAK